MGQGASARPPEETAAAPDGLTDNLRSMRTRAILQDLRIVFRAIQSYSKRVEKKCGVSSTMLWVLWELYAANEMRISAVARALSIHQSTASNLLDKLEKRGLIARKRGGEGQDQRVVFAYLTDKGRELLGKAPGPAQGPLTEALDNLPDETLAGLNRALEELVSILSIKDVGAGLEPVAADFE